MVYLDIVREITTIREVEPFCQQNIYEILQKLKRWIQPNKKECQVARKLFLAALVFSGAANEGNFFKMTSKAKREKWARNFDNAIRNWLDSKYPHRVHFTEAAQVIYNKRLATRLAKFGGEEWADEPTRDCILNRSLYMECSSSCVMGVKCDNRDIQKAMSGEIEWRKIVDVKYINPLVGVGAVAAQRLEPGQCLGYVTGEGLDLQEFEKRSKESDYMFGVADEEKFFVWGIDPTKFGNHGRFFNNSCLPNCFFEVWTVDGYSAVKIRVHEDSQPIEPVSIDGRYSREKLIIIFFALYLGN